MGRSREGWFSLISNSDGKSRASTMSDLAVFAILPLILLGGLLAVLIATGVLDLKP